MVNKVQRTEGRGEWDSCATSLNFDKLSYYLVIHSQYNPLKIGDLLNRLIFAPRTLSFSCSVEYMLGSVQDFILIFFLFNMHCLKVT